MSTSTPSANSGTVSLAENDERKLERVVTSINRESLRRRHHPVKLRQASMSMTRARSPRAQLGNRSRVRQGIERHPDSRVAGTSHSSVPVSRFLCLFATNAPKVYENNHGPNENRNDNRGQG